MLKEFRSLGVFAAFSRWSLDICYGATIPQELMSKLLNSQNTSGAQRNLNKVMIVRE